MSNKTMTEVKFRVFSYVLALNNNTENYKGQVIYDTYEENHLMPLWSHHLTTNHKTKKQRPHGCELQTLRSWHVDKDTLCMSEHTPHTHTHLHTAHTHTHTAHTQTHKRRLILRCVSAGIFYSRGKWAVPDITAAHTHWNTLEVTQQD